jgi:hypothetical protein
MFQKYEATPSGLIFGGVFALILALFGLESFNQYMLASPPSNVWVLVLGDGIGLLVAIVGIGMLGSGIYSHLNRQKQEDTQSR